jgi:hypothetical protein
MIGPFRVSYQQIQLQQIHIPETIDNRRRHPFAINLIANERGWNFSAGGGLKYLIIISFTLRALVIFNFFTQMDDSALVKKE